MQRKRERWWNGWQGVWCVGWRLRGNWRHWELRVIVLMVCVDFCQFFYAFMFCCVLIIVICLYYWLHVGVKVEEVELTPKPWLMVAMATTVAAVITKTKMQLMVRLAQLQQHLFCPWRQLLTVIWSPGLQDKELYWLGLHCNDYSPSGHNSTRALLHVLCICGKQHIKPCFAKIPSIYCCYKDL